MEVGTVVYFCNPETTIPEDGFIKEMAYAFTGLSPRESMYLEVGEKVWVDSERVSDTATRRGTLVLVEIIACYGEGRYRFRCGQVEGELHGDWEGCGDSMQKISARELNQFTSKYPDRFKKLDGS